MFDEVLEVADQAPAHPNAIVVQAVDEQRRTVPAERAVGVDLHRQVEIVEVTRAPAQAAARVVPHVECVDERCIDRFGKIVLSRPRDVWRGGFRARRGGLRIGRGIGIGSLSSTRSKQQREAARDETLLPLSPHC